MHKDSGRSARGAEAAVGAEDRLALPNHLPVDDELAPDAEAAQLRLEFDTEMERLKAA